MKKIIFINFIIIFFVLSIVYPVFSSESDIKSTFLLYFNNIYGEFTSYETNYALNNLVLFLKSKYNIQIIDNGFSTRNLSMELVKKFNLSSLAEMTGKVNSINYSNGKYRTGIYLNLIFDSIKTDQIDLETSKSFEGEEANSMLDSRAFTLSKAYIEIFTENIEKILEIVRQ